MNHTPIAILVGFVAGIVGGYCAQSLAPSAGEGGRLQADEVVELRREVAELKSLMRGGREGAATLSGRDAAAHVLRAEAGGATLTAAAEEALLAQVETRIAAAVDKRIAELQSKEGGGLGKGRKRKKKDATLAEVAVELELSGQQEDELRRIYADSEREWLAMLAAPDGDPEDVKRELREAAESPDGAQAVMMKYLPKLLPNIAQIMAMEQKRQAAIVKTVGPENARRLDKEFNVEESDFLGLGGGGLSIGATMETDAR